MDNHCIFEFDNFLSKEKCDEIIKRFEHDPDKRECRIYGSGGDHVNTQRKNGMELVVDNDNIKWSDILELVLYNFEKNIGSQIIEKFCRHFEKYGEDPNIIHKIWFEHKGSICLPCTVLQISRTTQNTEFAWHHDSGNPLIYFTALLYLNSIKPENGGATEFLTGKRVQPEAGKLLLFPAVWSNPHRGMFVSESKYCLAFGVGLARP